ncbi:hypothetical protein PPYR_13185 [Photinus pyralis]|uniref:CRAL-TRIO domain-containing protein n=2 Tax=Photinus pyralis TaxID=7054 RepID=A0A5N4A8C6_PHOPY|nr:retinol-binding protein pinta-like [Photinus pyralis]KAB0793565.1 hypothetical protein PPYR_13185 [Photinus pyralis]
MEIRGISKELQEIADNELNECAERIGEDLQHIRDWLRQQPHLCVRSDDQWFITFLRGCKWSLQRAKEKLDYFYAMRTLIPEFFQNRDPMDPALQSILELGFIFPLPKTQNSSGPRIIFVNYSVIDYDTINFHDLVKLFFMTLDLLMVEDDNFVISGQIYIARYADLPLSFYLKATPTIAKKFAMCWQFAYPLRVAGFIGTDTPVGMEKLFNAFVIPFLSKKLQDRIHMYSSQNHEKVYSHVPKAFFPEEFGGENGSCHVLAEQWKTKMESYREWFLEDAQYMSKEELRPGKPITYSEEFGMEGTFRKLILD